MERLRGESADVADAHRTLVVLHAVNQFPEETRLSACKCQMQRVASVRQERRLKGSAHRGLSDTVGALNYKEMP